MRSGRGVPRSPVSITVIVPTVGRDTLRDTLDSIVPQLTTADEVIVAADGYGAWEKAVAIWPGTVERPQTGDWGNQHRDWAMTVAKGRMLMFCDDDDTFHPDALQTVRRRTGRHRTRLHLFRMTCRDGILWGDATVRSCNVGTPMFVVPNIPKKLGAWRNPDGPMSDHRFIADTVALHDRPPIFHEEVIAHVG